MRLAGCRILICEDEAMIALDLEEACKHEGAIILGPLSHRQRALALLENTTPDAALLDISLADGECTDIAKILASRKVPFAAVTVLPEPDRLAPDFAYSRWFTKPFCIDEIIDYLVSEVAKKPRSSLRP